MIAAAAVNPYDYAGQVYPAAEPYIHTEVAAEPYVHEEIEAEPYVHEEIEAEPYVHEEIEAEPYVHQEIEAEPYVHAEVYDSFSTLRNPFMNTIFSSFLTNFCLL